MVRGDLSKGARVKVAFYGRLAETVGTELDIDAPPGCSIEELRNMVIAEHPDADETLRNKRSRACVGDAIVHDSYVIDAAEKVEFLPPVSGG
jgi:molybdopterin converting factor small subunit